MIRCAEYWGVDANARVSTLIYLAGWVLTVQAGLERANREREGEQGERRTRVAMTGPVSFLSTRLYIYLVRGFGFHVPTPHSTIKHLLSESVVDERDPHGPDQQSFYLHPVINITRSDTIAQQWM